LMPSRKIMGPGTTDDTTTTTISTIHLEEGAVADDEDNNILLYDTDKNNLTDSSCHSNGNDTNTKTKKKTRVRASAPRRTRRSTRSSSSVNMSSKDSKEISDTRVGLGIKSLSLKKSKETMRNTPSMLGFPSDHDASGEDNDSLGPMEDEVDGTTTNASDDDEKDDSDDHSVSKVRSVEKTKGEKQKELPLISQIEVEEAVSLAVKAASKVFGWGASKVESFRKISGSDVTNSQHQLSESQKSSKNDKYKNKLTDLIPGYTAPMTLDSSSLDKYRDKRQLLMSKTKNTSVLTNNDRTSSPNIPKSFKTTVRNRNNAFATNTSKNWFGMEAVPLTPQLKSDLAIIRNRNYLDPKKFYKSSDIPRNDKSGMRFLQVGTVVEGASEFYSSRLSKKERRANITEQAMAEVYDERGSYVREKFTKMSREKTAQYQARSGGGKRKRGGGGR